ncbi:hypothetical protein VTK56DRAFT_594 [Thermocarpiscus australiensis]
MDNSVYPLFDSSTSMSLDPGELTSRSFRPTPAHSSPAAFLGGATEQSSFCDETRDSMSGADPPPREGPGSGTPSTPSSVTEFTKRRNWRAKVVEELQDLLQILDANGRLKYVSPNAEHLTGYKPSELHEVFLRDLLHPDDVGVFTLELDESIASGTPFRVFYRLRKKFGNYAVFESVGHAHIADGKFAPHPDKQTPFCQAVFMMARPYPTKNAALLDSFLEHKMENERLKRKIAELKKEEQDEAEESQRTPRQSQERRHDGTSSDGAMHLGAVPLQDHADTIELLTGLRYHEGERSLSTGNAGPTLIKGDVGIAISVDRDPRGGEKKKRLKVAEEYVCTDCGTLESPEWRKGPAGPKTLCNACGLRWAKKEKKKSVNVGGTGKPAPDTPG